MVKEVMIATDVFAITHDLRLCRTDVTDVSLLNLA